MMAKHHSFYSLFSHFILWQVLIKEITNYGRDIFTIRKLKDTFIFPLTGMAEKKFAITIIVTDLSLSFAFQG